MNSKFLTDCVQTLRLCYSSDVVMMNLEWDRRADAMKSLAIE